MKFFQEDYIKNLPDCYNKKTSSNNYKLCQLMKYDKEKFRQTLLELDDSLDLEKASGHTLDLYGQTVGQNRGITTDAQYRVLIKTKIERNRCNSSYKSIINCICRALNCNPSDVLITEQPTPCTVMLRNVSLETVLKADFTPYQFSQIIKSLMPAGVDLEGSVYAGTFEFADGENVASTTAGFRETETDETMGGYLGALSDDGEQITLPI